MTIAEALRESGLPSIDAELLAAHAFKKSRTWVMAHANDDFDSSALRSFREFCDRRKRGEPVAYILGEKEFFGRMFRVIRGTLIPRPATEELVKTALDVLAGKSIDVIRSIDTQIVAWSVLKSSAHDVKLVVDIGTGSGCIAVTLACERPDLQIIATDISGPALIVARQNAVNHGVSDRIIFKQGDGLSAAFPIKESFIVVSNPPYIPSSIKLDHDVMDFEPASALFAGEKGTDILDPLIEQSLQHSQCRGFIVECKSEQVGSSLVEKGLTLHL